MKTSDKIFIAQDNVTLCVKRCGELSTHTGFIECREKNEGIVIDAPFGAFETSKSVFHPDTKIIALLLTHGHWDHVGDAILFHDNGTRVFAHHDDRWLVEHADEMQSFVTTEHKLLGCPVDKEINHDGFLEICSWLTIFCQSVPGHAAGDATFYIPSFQTAFVGDTLFKDCIGRYDLPGGNRKLLIDGIRQKLLTLPPDTIIIPGHGEWTTISDEQKNFE